MKKKDILPIITLSALMSLPTVVLSPRSVFVANTGRIETLAPRNLESRVSSIGKKNVEIVKEAIDDSLSISPYSYWYPSLVETDLAELYLVDIDVNRRYNVVWVDYEKGQEEETLNLVGHLLQNIETGKNKLLHVGYLGLDENNLDYLVNSVLSNCRENGYSDSLHRVLSVLDKSNVSYEVGDLLKYFFPEQTSTLRYPSTDLTNALGFTFLRMPSYETNIVVFLHNRAYLGDFENARKDLLKLSQHYQFNTLGLRVK